MLNSENKTILTTKDYPQIKPSNLIIPKRNGLKAVLNLSDWHAGHMIDLERMNGINAYIELPAPKGAGFLG